MGCVAALQAKGTVFVYLLTYAVFLAPRLTNSRHDTRHGRKCPVVYEIKGGRMIVRGEDRGDAVEYLDKAKKLREFLKLCHQVSVMA